MDETTTNPTASTLADKFQAQLDDMVRVRHSYSVVTLSVEELTLLVELLTPVSEEA